MLNIANLAGGGGAKLTAQQAITQAADYCRGGGVPGGNVPGPQINWQAATSMLAAPAGQGLSPTAYAFLQFAGADEALRTGQISVNVYKALTSREVPADLRGASQSGLIHYSPWTVLPAIAAGAASAGATSSFINVSDVPPYSLVQPANFQGMQPTVELAARVSADADTLSLAIPLTIGGQILPCIDWDRTTLGAADAQRNRAVTLQGTLGRHNINAIAEAIAVNTFLYRYRVAFFVMGS